MTSIKELEELFGPVMSRYTQAQAIEDGFLVDVSETAREAGFTWPVLLTASLDALCHPKTKGAQSYEGRLWDVLHLAHLAAKSPHARGKDLLHYGVKLGRKLEWIKMSLGGGDDGEPVITLDVRTT